MADDRLRAYRARRKPGKSPEPQGGDQPSGKRPVFVVQEHQASTHHFDFRLEADGVLKSWAVPKGPSTDPRDKRLAIPVEDHPLDYADFEGVIPKGEYGGGSVIVWDRGTYDNITIKDGKPQPVAKALEQGHLMVELHGQKLSGGYALQPIGRGDDERWLLIKMRDEHADARRRRTSTQRSSVLSGRSVAQVAKQLAAGGDDRSRPDSPNRQRRGGKR
jgi:DNA ligase D-like protein (predicted 3'-phosphoesterase)